MIELWTVQYIADPIRYETKNVGVLVRKPAGADCRMLGAEDPVRIDLEPFRKFARDAGEDAWAYREWVAWFDELCRAYGRVVESDGDYFNDRLRHLEETNAPFVARYVGPVAPIKGESSDALIQDLFEAMVDPPRVKPKNPFQKRLERLVDEVGLRDLEKFEENVEVEFSAIRGRPEETVRLSFLVDGSPRTLFKVVRLRTSRQSLLRQVNDALYTFRLTADNGFAEKERCVVLTEAPPPGKGHYLGRLREVAHVVNVTSPEAARTLRQILKPL
ncbi:hypothetical protein [uncultured Desulfuromonas sp.]|uniref:hypothetical protein n=1 Tax=uncultured Desulfuromonas sp. TaxID=181013 RepID=UPI002622E5D7|nr:hypothetical protein [uncultured Desulfuromonas sp.]